MSQSKKIADNFLKVIEKTQKKLAEGIEKDLISLLKKRVPIDTETLQDSGLKAETEILESRISITFFVDNINLPYIGRQSIRADVLGLILDVGIRRGTQLTRTRSQPKNPAGSKTAGWFTKDFRQDVMIYLNNKMYMKHLN